MRFLVVACLALAGCLWATPRSDSALGFGARVVLDDGGHPEGAAVHGEIGYAGLYMDVDVTTREVTQPADPAGYRAVGLGFTVRASLLGILATEHRLERYFDFGAELGGGGGAAFAVPKRGVESVTMGWIGGWVELGTVSLGPDRYLAITGNLRREAVHEDPWLARTQLLIGLAWRERGPVSASDLRWRD